MITVLQDQPEISHSTRMVFLLLALTIFTVSGRVSAANKNLPLDVVLVMDSSGSMKKTDPQELRKAAAKLLISLLGERDRASVVSFSDQGYPVAYLTPVKGKQNEAALFAAVDRISDKGVYTNLLGGVQAALRVINRNPLNGQKPIIVLMTDGKMDLGSSTENQANSESLLNDLVPQLKRQNIELHTVAFTNQSDKTYLENLANATGGKFNLAHNDKQLHDVYTAIFEQNKQPDMLAFDGGKFTIDKAVKQITLVGSKESEKVALSLIAPDGSVITAKNKPSAMHWFVSQDFDLINIRNPKAGIWRLKSSTGKNKLYITTDLNFQLEVEPQEVHAHKRLTVRAWLENKGKALDKSSILSKLTMELRVHTPDGQTRILKMKPQYKKNSGQERSGIYLNHITPPAAGRYLIEVIAKGSAFSRVRNSLVKVLAPASGRTDNNAVNDSQPSTIAPKVAPATESIQPSVGTTDDTTQAGTNLVSRAQHAGPITSDTAPAPPASLHPETKQNNTAANTETKPAARKTEVKSATKPSMAAKAPGSSAKKPAKTEKTPVKKAPKEAKHQKPDLLKALIIFLTINGVLIAIGALFYHVYRWKKKNIAIVMSEYERRQDNSIYHHV